jgi:hypothetical protein
VGFVSPNSIFNFQLKPQPQYKQLQKVRIHIKFFIALLIIAHIGLGEKMHGNALKGNSNLLFFLAEKMIYEVHSPYYRSFLKDGLAPSRQTQHSNLR